MNSKRVIFLLLAVIVAGSTAFLARAWLQGERAAILAASNRPEKPASSAQKVLVARNPIRIGQIVKPDDLRWQAWPAGDLAQTYIIEGKRPLNDFVGAVGRRSISAGEPITEGKLVAPGTRSFLSAVLQPGTRAVSISITATSAVSGFIYAGDRVDVLLTHTLNGADGQHKATETILRNARVIAMDQKVDAAPSDKPDVAKTATLELTPKQSEIVTLAEKMGDLSLVLRSLQENDDGADATAAESAPAQPGDSYTRDVQVSPLISDGPPPKQSSRVVYVLRGSSQGKPEIDGTAGPGTVPGDDGRATDGKAARTTTFTRTPSVTP
ncbi:pilus assembly protein CpaB [Enhydrobacter aerosaccus]|uniref:Pilus assembly protein CpaB n=1 Tax=Enhydrobacter aerosaccus TaxID=225324 RepID=A0A1T4T926_9HYPH|nr:Flp pilus assembly protein CpaB [Enhydrobacter aerosaccus]SKA36926.1 pilus assembly protein CpaB [Enhydrobacter aerosaccus]